MVNAYIGNININCTFDQQNVQGLYTQNGTSSGTFKNADPTKPDAVETLSDIKGMVSGALPKQEFILYKKVILFPLCLTSLAVPLRCTMMGVMVDNNVKVSGTVTTGSSIDMTLVALKGCFQRMFYT